MENFIYSHRFLQIFNILAKANGHITVSEIAKEIHVSNRTVIRELKNTEHFLSQFEVRLVSKKGYGYELLGEKENKIKFSLFLEKSSKQLAAQSPELRRERLLVECLHKRGIDKLNYFAYLFNVSEGTVSNDIKIVEEWLHGQNLSIMRRQTSGIELIGTEEDIHQAKANFLHDQLVKENVEEYIYKNGKFDELEYFKRYDDKNSIMDLLNREILFSVITTLKDVSVLLLNNITKSSYLGLIIHLTIAIDRIKKDETIEMAPKILDKLKKDSLFEQSKEFAHYFEISQNVTFPEAEVAYILMHLKGTRIRVLLQDNNEDIKDDYECIKIVEQMILNFSKIIDFDYTDDEDLFTGLMAHLKPALNRITYDLDIRNPLLEQIKEQFSEIFQITKETCEFIKDNKECNISEHEIGYLTLHFGAAVERQKALIKNENKLNIGVVCMSGIGISVLLVSTIKSSFNQLGNVLPLSLEEICDYNRMKQFDAIVSTLAVETSKIPVIQVTPLLEEHDLEDLNKFFNQVKLNKRKKYSLIYKNDEEIDVVNMRLIDNIKLAKISYPMTKEQVLNNLVKLLDETKFIKNECIKAILEREQLGEVKLLEREFVLYHANLTNLNSAHIVFFRFENYASIENTQDKLCLGLILLLPKPAKKSDRYTLGNVSHIVYEDIDFLNIVKFENESNIIEYLKEKLREG